MKSKFNYLNNLKKEIIINMFDTPQNYTKFEYETSTKY